jgi:hypothetical protein
VLPEQAIDVRPLHDPENNCIMVPDVVNSVATLVRLMEVLVEVAVNLYQRSLSASPVAQPVGMPALLVAFHIKPPAVAAAPTVKLVALAHSSLPGAVAVVLLTAQMVKLYLLLFPFVVVEVNTLT